jgi:hypothetical protein
MVPQQVDERPTKAGRKASIVLEKDYGLSDLIATNDIQSTATDIIFLSATFTLFRKSLLY